MDYVTLKGRVEDEINRVDLSTNIATWINEARGEIADGTLPVLTTASQGAYRFSWTYDSDTVSTSIATNAFPTDMIEEMSVLLKSKEKPLQKIMPQYFDELLYSETDRQYAIGQTGTPMAYIPRGANYELFPDPASSIEIYFRHWAYPADLIAATDEEVIDTTVPSLIIVLTCLKAARYLHDDKLIKLFKEQTQEYYTTAVNRDRMKKFANRKLRVKTHSDYDTGHWKGMYQIGDV